MFANDSIFAVQSVNNPDVNLVVSIIALVANIAAVSYVIYRAKKLGVNPYTHEIFAGKGLRAGYGSSRGLEGVCCGIVAVRQTPPAGCAVHLQTLSV